MSNAKRKYKDFEVTKNRITHKEVEKKYRFQYIKDSLIPTLPDYLAYVMIAMVLWLTYFFSSLAWNFAIEKSEAVKSWNKDASTLTESTSLNTSSVTEYWGSFFDSLKPSPRPKSKIETF